MRLLSTHGKDFKRIAASMANKVCNIFHLACKTDDLGKSLDYCASEQLLQKPPKRMGSRSNCGIGSSWIKPLIVPRPGRLNVYCRRRRVCVRNSTRGNDIRSAPFRIRRQAGDGRVSWHRWLILRADWQGFHKASAGSYSCREQAAAAVHEFHESCCNTTPWCGFPAWRRVLCSASPNAPSWTSSSFFAAAPHCIVSAYSHTYPAFRLSARYRSVRPVPLCRGSYASAVGQRPPTHQLAGSTGIPAAARGDGTIA